MPYSWGTPKNTRFGPTGSNGACRWASADVRYPASRIGFRIRAWRGGKALRCIIEGASVFHRNRAGYGQCFGDGKSDGRLQDTSSPQPRRSARVHQLQGWTLREVARIRAGHGWTPRMLVQHMERKGGDHACEHAYLATTSIYRRAPAPVSAPVRHQMAPIAAFKNTHGRRCHCRMAGEPGTVSIGGPWLAPGIDSRPTTSRRGE